MICDCIDINILIDGTNITAYLYPNGNIVNGAPQYESEFNGTILFIEYDAFIGGWIAYLVNFPPFAQFIGLNTDCPFGQWNVLANSNDITRTDTRPCIPPPICSCIRLCMQQGETEICIELNEPNGFFNQHGYWQFELFGYNFELIFNGSPIYWNIDRIDVLGQSPNLGERWFATKDSQDCPTNLTFNSINDFIQRASTTDCLPCKIIQERTIKRYDAITLPEVFMEQDRGFKVCCDCPMLVLGSPESETWKTDKTSAWIKLSSPADSSSFTLLKNGQPVAFTPDVFSFPNEPNAYYTTINWYNVLQSDGIGCYELKVGYNIAGVISEFTWGKYDLKPYSVVNALQTARIRVKYNLKQEIEGIDFTGANVEDCIRFSGFIGERQPNTEIDNLIYQDRVMKTVIRENLDTFIITTDPLLDCFIRVLTDLFLLSENEMYISDYNAHNHSYRILDIPVTLEETSEIDYLDKFQRRAKLTAVVGLRKKNKRTYY